jgi:hypothetical protein
MQLQYGWYLRENNKRISKQKIKVKSTVQLNTVMSSTTFHAYFFMLPERFVSQRMSHILKALFSLYFYTMHAF